MKKLISLCFGLVTIVTSYSQLGCTDTTAINFDKNATINDGSCQYLDIFQDFSFEYNLPAKISESSGLIYNAGFLWTHNDSGNPNSFYKIDPKTGTIIQEISISNAPNTDWEDITADEHYIYIGDVGNNDGNRKDLKILKINKDSILSKTESFIAINAEKIAFSYTDQTSFITSKTHNFDCESIISKGDSLYLFTKNRGDLKTREYRLPKIPGNYSISPIDSFNVGCLITGADYNSNTNEIVLIGYSSSKDKSYVFYLNEFHSNLFFSGNKRKLQLTQKYIGLQTEGICFLSNDSLAFSCELSAIPASIFSYNKNETHFLGIDELTLLSETTIYPNPSNGKFTLSMNYSIKSIIILDMFGNSILQKTFNLNDKNIVFDESINLKSGVYQVKIITEKGFDYKKLIIN
jgi:hypothetical protein